MSMTSGPIVPSIDRQVASCLLPTVSVPVLALPPVFASMVVSSIVSDDRAAA